MNLQIVLVFGLIILAIFFIGYFQATPKSTEQENIPRIDIEPKFFDFGVVDFGKVVNFTFKVKNLGKGVLEIKRVATSCGCTTAQVSKEKVNPNEEIELFVKYDTAAMGSGPHGRGRQERIIYLKSNDPVNPQVEVMIYGTVK